MSTNTIAVVKRGAIARITLDRPRHGNAIDGGVLRGLADACAAIAADDGVRVAVLTAGGDVFSTGWDWSALGGLAGVSPAGLAEALSFRGRTLGDPFRCLAELPKPVVCAVNGDAIGGGLALALACDIRIAAEGARFGLPETALGLLPLGGALQRLARVAGRGTALEMALTGEEIDAPAALRCGLVSSVVPASGGLLAEADAIAGRIAERGPLALQYAKEAVSRGIDMPLEQALRYETDLTIILQTTEDRAEGVRAFLEKRSPRFKGR